MGLGGPVVLSLWHSVCGDQYCGECDVCLSRVEVLRIDCRTA